MSTTQNKPVTKNKPVTNQPSTSWPRMVADIGGTNARFALEVAPQQIEQAEVLPCHDYDTIIDAAREFLKRVGNPKISHAAVAIANPILGDWGQMTNHHWSFSIETTRQSLGLETLILLNDFTAQALAITQTKCEDLVQVGEKSWWKTRRRPLSVPEQVWASAGWFRARPAGCRCRARAAMSAFRRLTMRK